jgi:hypothetical protein
MEAFHNKQEIKNKYIQRMKNHIASDELVRGLTFENGKGCAVGCTLNKYNHEAYETELGIPRWLAKLEDTLFENMNLEKSKTFPLLFLESINIGANLDNIKTPFLIYILESILNKLDHNRFSNVLQSINNVINLYKSNEKDLNKFAYAAANAAYAATAGYTKAAAEAAYATADAAVYIDAVYASAYGDIQINDILDTFLVFLDILPNLYLKYHAYIDAVYASAYVDARINAYDNFADKLLEFLRNEI